MEVNKEVNKEEKKEGTLRVRAREAAPPSPGSPAVKNGSPGGGNPAEGWTAQDVRALHGIPNGVDWESVTADLAANALVKKYHELFRVFLDACEDDPIDEARVKVRWYQFRKLLEARRYTETVRQLRPHPIPDKRGSLRAIGRSNPQHGSNGGGSVMRERRTT